MDSTTTAPPPPPPQAAAGDAPAQSHHELGATKPPEGYAQAGARGTGGAANGTVGSFAPGGTAAAEREGVRPGGMETTPSPDAHVHELASQASKLRGMSGDLKRLLQVAAGEVQGALEDTRDSLGVAVAAATATAVGTQTAGGVIPTKDNVDALEEELCGVKAAARELETQKLRLDDELGGALEELAKIQGLLRDKTAEVRRGKLLLCVGIVVVAVVIVVVASGGWYEIRYKALTFSFSVFRNHPRLVYPLFPFLSAVRRDNAFNV